MWGNFVLYRGLQIKVKSELSYIASLEIKKPYVSEEQMGNNQMKLPTINQLI